MFGIKNWIFAMETQDLPCLWRNKKIYLFFFYQQKLDMLDRRSRHLLPFVVTTAVVLS